VEDGDLAVWIVMHPDFGAPRLASLDRLLLTGVVPTSEYLADFTSHFILFGS
jgi:hypothetical protein